MANAEAWNLGAQLGHERNMHQRDRKEMLEDEQRQYRAQDIFAQRKAIGDNPALSEEQKKKEFQQLELGLQQLYPAHNPGLLHKDWPWLQPLIGLATRRQKPAAENVTMGPAPDVTVVPAEQSVTLPADTAFKNDPLGQTTPGTPEQQITLPAVPVTIPGGKTAYPTSETMAQAKVKGLIAPGNLPVWNRPIVTNADGTHSSEFSFSFVDENPQSKYYGKEVLVPTIADGKFLTPDGKKPQEGSDAEGAMKKAAMDRYKATGQHLGVFDNPKHADKYANILHSREERPKPTAAAYGPKPTWRDQQAQAQQDRAQKAAGLDMLGLPPTPEQEAQVKLRGVKATYDQVNKLLGGQLSEEDERRFIYSALGMLPKEKYMAQLYPFTDEEGMHYYRVPLEPGGQPEELDFHGQTMVPKTSGSAGSDFWKTVIRKYGPNPTAEQIEAERREWAAMGAHGTSTQTYSSTDAAGNTSTHTTRTPTFAGQQPGMLPQTPGTQTAPGAGGTRPAAGAAAGGQAGAGGAQAVAPGGQPPMSVPPGRGAAEIMDVIRGVAHYKFQVPATTRGGSRGKFLEEVLKVNPRYDATKWDAAHQARLSFTAGGKDAGNLKSLGTAIGHLDELAQTAAELDNTDFPKANELRNAYKINTGNDTPTNFDTNTNAVAGEMATVFKNTSGTDQEISAWRGQMNFNLSPRQIYGGIGKMTDLMATRLTIEANQYRDTFGSLDGFPLLDEETVNILKKFKTPGAQRMVAINEEAKRSSEPQAAPPQAAPQQPAPQARPGRKPGDPVTLKNGQTIIIQHVHPDGSFD